MEDGQKFCGLLGISELYTVSEKYLFLVRKSPIIDLFLDPGELVHHVETKYIPNELGGQLVNDVEGWLLLQEHVETFSFSARRIARRLAQFVGVLNQVSTDNVKF